MAQTLSALTSDEREVFERIVDKLEKADFGKDPITTYQSGIEGELNVP